jgi:hypothetical protein
MRFSRFIPVAFAAMAALPAVSNAQVSVKYIDTKFTSGNTVKIGDPFVDGTADVGPYLAQYTSPASSPFDVYCIDWDNTFTIGGTFNARVLSFNDAVSTSLSFNGVSNYAALKRILGQNATYAVGGNIIDNPSEYLARLATASKLASGFGAAPATDWDERHFAIWGLFNTNAIFLPDFDGTNDPTTMVFDAFAAASAPGYNYSNWRIIMDARAWDTRYTGTFEQGTITEVQSVVPEPGTYMLVGAGLIGMFGAVRRRNRAATI